MRYFVTTANLTSRGLVRTSGTSVQAEELGIVLVVLFLWAVAIALFINRWGKIRQMEPYHPYVETEAPTPTNTIPTTIPQMSNQVILYIIILGSFSRISRENGNMTDKNFSRENGVDKRENFKPPKKAIFTQNMAIFQKQSAIFSRYYYFTRQTIKILAKVGFF